MLGKVVFAFHAYNARGSFQWGWKCKVYTSLCCNFIYSPSIDLFPGLLQSKNTL